MARRSAVQRDPRISDDPELSAYPDAFDDPGPRSAPARGRRVPRRGGWSGGGGRWLVWVGRAVLWALIVVIVVNGVRAPFERFTRQGATGQNAPAPADQGFPRTQATSFASQFAAVYLNFDAVRASERAGRLAPFLPDGAEPQFGWDGLGRMSAGAIQPYDVQAEDAQNAVVTLMFQAGNRRQLLSVPVFYDSETERFVVSGRPGILPAPASAALPAEGEPQRDATAEQELRTSMANFFKAYAASDTASLQQYAAAGVTLEGFGGAFTFVELKDLVVPLDSGASRKVTATVVWGVPGDGSPNTDSTSGGDPGEMNGKLEQSYLLTVVKQGDKWFVESIGGAGRSVG
ncbi:conjugal transfer protein [Planobispora rosea]|uniref:conjugal transfer protein n=1 Tax=Planobispora rosea TaxID=35762 RepID=UPI00083A50D9|nr:conjugal transfer protein [Planobispora rosea]